MSKFNIRPSVKYIRDESKKHLLMKNASTLSGYERNTMYNDNKNVNMWKENNIPVIELATFKNMPTIEATSFFFNFKDQVNDEVKQRINKLISLIKDKTTMRITGPLGDELFNYLTMLCPNKEIYLPFKNYNKNIQNPKGFCKDNRLFSVVKGMYKNYDKLPGFARASNSRDVEMILGNNLDTKVKCILIYSSCNQFALNNKTDLIKLGNCYMALRMAHALNIPLVNLACDDAENKIRQIFQLEAVDTTQVTLQQEINVTEDIEELSL